MSRLPSRRLLIAACILLLALAIMTVVGGCGGGDAGDTEGAAGPAAGPDQFADAGDASPGQVGSRRGMAMERSPFGGGGGRRAAMMGRGTRGAAAAAPAAGAPVAAEEAPAAPRARALSEVEKAERVRDFAAAYGPVKLVQQQNWDDRILEWVSFSHQGQEIKLPLSMVVDTPKPQSLEGYFTIYPASGSPGKVVSTQTITGSSSPESITAASKTLSTAPPAASKAQAASAAADTTAAAPTASRAARMGRMGGGMMMGR